MSSLKFSKNCFKSRSKFFLIYRIQSFAHISIKIMSNGIIVSMIIKVKQDSIFITKIVERSIEELNTETQRHRGTENSTNSASLCVSNLCVFCLPDSHSEIHS